MAMMLLSRLAKTVYKGVLYKVLYSMHSWCAYTGSRDSLEQEEVTELISIVSLIPRLFLHAHAQKGLGTRLLHRNV